MKMIQGRKPKRLGAVSVAQYGPGQKKKGTPNQLKLKDIVKNEDGNYVWDHLQYTAPKATKYKVGDKTGARRAPEPTVFRPFGTNTRAHCYPLPDTGILDNVYSWPPQRSHDPPCQLVHGAVPCQAGNPQVNEKVDLLKAGSHIWNCLGKKSR